MTGEEAVASARDLTWFKSSYSAGDGGECVEVAVTWHKSSYSSGEGGECVEVAMTWQTSSHSSEEGGQCVEVAACPEVLHVRDSKVTQGPVLDLSPAAWTKFVTFATRREA